jgi:diguanylate cyclase
MDGHNQTPGRAGGLLGWLGLGRMDAQAEAATSAGTGDRRDAVRMRSLELVGAFLSRHQLEVSAGTLTIAQHYISGSDPAIVRLIDRQLQSGRPVTQEWLDQALARNERSDELAMLAQLMQRLESSIDEFSKTSREARSATSDYGSALEEHVGELEQVSRAGEVISELASITKVMLKRTRDIEKQMVRSEAQTRTLKRRLEEAKRSAEEDHLTGLPNRRAFETRFEEEFREARAAMDTLCVAFCDIDHFKRVNDQHGHEAGDRVIRLVADALSRISNDRCHVARHGGEEFVMLFRGLSVRDVHEQLDRLREQLSERRLVNRATDEPFGQITFSGGIADVFASGDPRNALRAADIALYRAKQEGRNRIEVATSADMIAPDLAA